MRLCLAIQSLRSCTLEEAAAIARALGFNAMELDGVMDTTLGREGIINIDTAEVQRAKDLDLIIPTIHWTFATGSLYPVINDPDPAVRQDNREQIKGLIEFCHEAGIASILVLPGMLLPGQSAEDSHKLSAEVLNEFVTIGDEPHVNSSFESPEAARWLMEHVPGSGLVLDYSHFICQGYTQPEVDVLAPYAAHVHFRQAKSGLLQTKLEDGTINFALVLDNLRQVGYDGYLSVEYVHQDFIGATNVDVLTETVKMRDFLLEHLSPFEELDGASA
jgi:sugar phosphate isomerase/epimerase